MGRLLYHFFIILMACGMRIASIWNEKARRWTSGRRRIFIQVEEKLRTLKNVSGRRVWMHCASLGEFEQGRPLLEEIKKQYPDLVVILSFFSPSGYEVRKHYPGADVVFYLPADRPGNVRKLLDLIQPALVLWIRYEFWHLYLRELKRRNIPVLLISALFRKQHLFFQPWGGFWRQTLRTFTHIFVQQQESAALLAEIGFTDNVTVSGDTRFDRVSEIAEAFTPLPVIESFCKGHKVLVAGSTWPKDEKELSDYINASCSMRVILAPHEIGDQRIDDIQQTFPDAVLYSDWEKKGDMGSRILIINNIGMLSRLYAYADIAYVGGGFGKQGLHNILEAAVYGKPVVIGPVYQKHYEAVEMIHQGGAISVSNAGELAATMHRLVNNEDELNKRGAAASAYIRENRGATNSILQYIQRNRLCTN